MKAVIGDGKLPVFLTLHWLVWWFLNQTEYESVVVSDTLDYDSGVDVYLKGKELKITYNGPRNCTYEIDLSNVDDFSKVCTQLTMETGEIHASWYHYDLEMHCLTEKLIPQLTDRPVSMHIAGNVPK